MPSLAFLMNEINMVSRAPVELDSGLVPWVGEILGGTLAGGVAQLEQ